MKTAIFAGLLTAAAPAMAGEIFVEFDITGSFTIDNFRTLELEVDDSGKYMGAHGSALMANGLSAPATGTCFLTLAGGVFCNLRVDQASINVELDASLKGTISARDANGFTTDAAPITLADLYRTSP